MPKQYSRRAALQLCGVITGVGFAGCASLTADGEPTTTATDENTTPTTSPTTSPATQTSSLTIGEPVTVRQGTATVEAVTTQQMLSVLKSGTHTEVYSEPETQFVVVDVITEGFDNPRQAVQDAVQLTLNSDRYEIGEKDLIRSMDTERPVSIAFPAPTELIDPDGAILWNDDSDSAVASWSLSQEVLDVLAAPPLFSIESFSVPETASPESSIDATISVKNTGDSDGEFLAELGSTQLSDQGEIAVDVPTRETVSHTESVSLHGQAGNEETIVLDWGQQTLERTVKIEG